MQPFCPLDGMALREVPAGLPETSSVLNDRYLVLEEIGGGGMGAIFRAHDLRARREVALKVLKPALVGKEQAVRRFFVEARAARALRHPNIVELFDFGVSREGYLYLAMELLPGGTLADLLATRGRLSVGEALLVTLGVVEALIHAHDHGVVHRDLKPENIFLVAWDRDGYFVKVLDFGVAAVADAESRGALHRGEVLGTPAYMSPEQVRGDIVDRRSDLYSLGIVLHEMLAGDPPYLAETAAEIMRAHLTGAPPPLPPLTVSAAVRKGVEGLLWSLLQRSPAERPTDAALVRARVRAVQDNLAIEDAGAVDAAILQDTLAPLRALTPFHERATLMLPGPGEALPDEFHGRPTVVMDPLDPAAAQAAPTIAAEPDSPSLAPGGPKRPMPWTLDATAGPAAPAAADGSADPDGVVISLVHVELDIGASEGGTFTARAMFAPEMEAFQAATMAAGGCVCFDTGDEVRVVFGLYSRDDPPWLGAIRVAADLLARVRRFRSATGLPVDVRIGVATDRVPAAITRTASPDSALRGSTVDVAVRLARMAAPGRVVLDDETRNRATRDWEYEDVGRIHVRGRDRMTRIFTLAKPVPPSAVEPRRAPSPAVTATATA
ncbi:MAG: protein kinase [Deltaproteobacteria bacterium]|nr:protein kinase [Deltaproteobacteria bacterium]